MSHARRVALVVGMALALPLAVGVPSVRGDEANAPGPATVAAPADPASLAAQMQAMEHAEHQLRKLLRDKSDDQAGMLALVQQAQQASLASRLLIPPHALKLSGDERARFMAGFRQALIEATVCLLRIESAILDKDHDKAASLLRELGAIEKNGHKTYNP